MGLIACPECQKQISDRAHQCPSCGYPIADRATPTLDKDVQTIEQTGKKWKTQQALAVVLMISGLVAIGVAGMGMTNDSGNSNTYLLLLTGGLAIALLGMLWLVITSFFAWWHHG